MPAACCAPSVAVVSNALKFLSPFSMPTTIENASPATKSVASAMTNLIWLLKVAPTATVPISTPSDRTPRRCRRWSRLDADRAIDAVLRAGRDRRGHVERDGAGAAGVAGVGGGARRDAGDDGAAPSTWPATSVCESAIVHLIAAVEVLFLGDDEGAGVKGLGQRGG
jgi:hypothetical protein